ncbi:BrnA antitoxin family protein [Microvirga sp. G4-2]|uniref:BrnA antitoxin family protein n=1 Tax=Microvirga sp. G4-2 TaxID=3434467 RepID=UPI0040449FA8
MSRSPGGRRPHDPLKAAEAAFKKVTTKPIEGAPKAPTIPGVKETVTLRIDQDVLEYFQEDGPGWQERINAALRKAAGKSDA